MKDFVLILSLVLYEKLIRIKQSNRLIKKLDRIQVFICNWFKHRFDFFEYFINHILVILLHIRMPFPNNIFYINSQLLSFINFELQILLQYFSQLLTHFLSQRRILNMIWVLTLTALLSAGQTTRIFINIFMMTFRLKVY